MTYYPNTMIFISYPDCRSCSRPYLHYPILGVEENGSAEVKTRLLGNDRYLIGVENGFDRLNITLADRIQPN